MSMLGLGSGSMYSSMLFFYHMHYIYVFGRVLFFLFITKILFGSYETLCGRKSEKGYRRRLIAKNYKNTFSSEKQ